jgi:hypothetical protein
MEEDSVYDSEFFARKDTSVEALEVNPSFHLFSTSKPKKCGDYLALYFEKCLSLRPDQVLSLLGSKINLTRALFAAGIHNKYEPLVYLLKCILEEVDTLVDLLGKAKDIEEVQSTMFVLSSGLHGGDANLIKITCEVLDKIGISLSKRRSLKMCIEGCMRWAMIDGAQGAYAALSFDTSMCERVAVALGNILIVGSKEWGIFINRAIPTAAMDNVEGSNVTMISLAHIVLYSGFMSAKGSSKERQGASLIDTCYTTITGRVLQELKRCLEGELKNENATLFFQCLHFLVDIWCFAPVSIEENPDIRDNTAFLPQSILHCVSRGVRCNSKNLQLKCLACMFHLFDHLVEQNSKYAPVIYKQIIFNMIECKEDNDVRVFIVDNVTQIFSKKPSIPVHIVVGKLP